jgi:tetratricopeptide (TPR) repeat protein
VSELADHPNRLLVTATPEGGETYAEVAHEAIFRRWGKLREWIAAEREFLIWRSGLERDRRRWNEAPEASKDDALLLGLALAQAQGWLVQRGEDLTRVDRVFIDLSQTAEHDRREARRQLEIERIKTEEEMERLRAKNEVQAQKERAEVARLRAERQARKRRNRSFAGIAVVVFAFLIWAGYVAYEKSMASQAVQLIVNSAQKLLDKLVETVEHGDITANGADDMLKVTGDIVKQARDVESTKRTNGLLINLGYTASDIYATLGKNTQAYDSAKVGRDLAEKLRAADPDDQDALRRLYDGIWRMGDAISSRGGDEATQEKALMEFQEAERLATRLADLAPGNLAHQRDRERIQLKIGDVRLTEDKPDAAIDEYNKALAIIRSAVVSAPDDRDLQRDFANTRRRIGQAFVAKNDFDRALVEFRVALEIRTGLAQGDRADDALQSTLATTHRDVANVFERRGELDAALEQYRLAIAIQERLIAKDSGNATWQFSIAVSDAGMASLLRRQHDLSGALELYRKAHAFRQALALKDPSNPAGRIVSP